MFRMVIVFPTTLKSFIFQHLKYRQVCGEKGVKVEHRVILCLRCNLRVAGRGFCFICKSEFPGREQLTVLGNGLPYRNRLYVSMSVPNGHRKAAETTEPQTAG